MFPVDHALLSDLLSHLLPLVWVDALQQLDQLHLVYCVLFPAALQLVKLFVEALTLLLSSLLLNAHNGFQEGNLADCVHVDLVEEFLEINLRREFLKVDSTATINIQVAVYALNLLLVKVKS